MLSEKFYEKQIKTRIRLGGTGKLEVEDRVAILNRVVSLIEKALKSEWLVCSHLASHWMLEQYLIPGLMLMPCSFSEGKDDSPFRKR